MIGGEVITRTTLPAGSTRGRNSLRHRPSLCHGDGRDADAPSYEDSLKEPERWALARYVQSLAGPKVAVQPSTGTVVVKRVSGPVRATQWIRHGGKVPAVPVPLMLLWQRNERAADEVLVKALHNGKEIAFLLEWKDEEVSTRFRRDRHFADAAAVMFSLAPNLPFAGRRTLPWGKEESGQHLVLGAGPADGPRRRGASRLAGFRARSGTRRLGGVRVMRPRSPLRPSAIVEDLNAEGFGTLTAQPRADQNVNGSGFYAAGRWRVVFAPTFAQRDARREP